LNWNWDHLRYFLALADAGSLSEAARQLDVSHTTVLRRVRAIEQSLETHLFDHTSQGHQLTPAGQSLHTEVQKMKLAVDDIARQISGVDQQIAGPVSITTTDTLGCYVMPDIIARLQRRYPELSISLRVANQISDLHNREADIAVRTCAEPPAELVGRKIATLNFVPCAARSYLDENGIRVFPVTGGKPQYVVLDKHFQHAPYSVWLAERIDQKSPTVIADGLLTACRLCVAGAGIAVLPEYLLRYNRELVQLDTAEPVVSNDLWILSHVDLRDTLRIRLVKRFLLEQLQQVFTGH
jgi:DNA-binding transcriptional LysR family regulator